MKVKIPAKNETIRNCTKLRKFLRPTQLFKAVQWWSNPCTQWLQVLQCDAFGGRIFIHVSQLRLVYRLHFFETSSSRNVNFSSGSKSRAFSYAASVCRSSFYVTTPGSLNWTHNCRISVKTDRSKDAENTPSVHIWYVKFLTSIATRKANQIAPNTNYDHSTKSEIGPSSTTDASNILADVSKADIVNLIDADFEQKGSVDGIPVVTE